MTIPAPAGLRTEYLKNPLGIDLPSPRFYWVLDHEERDQCQTAYQIIVSSERRLAREGSGDVWDSGEVNSPDSVNIGYAGNPLASGRRYFWRVRWWDKYRSQSPYSDIAFFETGLLHEADWKAKWIKKADYEEFTSKGSVLLGKDMGEYIHARAAYFRREFGARGGIRQARVYVCGLGFYELRLNGDKVGDHVLDPAQTDYNKIALYSTFDITELLGETNAVGVVLGNGRHIKNYGFGHPRLILQLSIEYENGVSESVTSDNSWKVSYGPLVRDGLYYGELYDARLEQTGWDRPEFDDSEWENAEIATGPKLAAQTCRPIRVTRRLRAEKLYSPQAGFFVYDSGRNFAGWVKLRVSGPRGTEVRLRHAELTHEDGTLNTSPNQNAEATDTYILKGDGEEEYEPRFTYHGFRYVEVTGFPGAPSLDSLEGCVVHTDVEKTGDFYCSNELINRIHENITWGQKSNLMSVPTDCPQRDERYGWLGDAALAAEESCFNFDMAAFYTKYLKDIQLAQTEEGGLPDTVPLYLGPLYPADPAWGTAYVTIAWLMYEFYGDTCILDEHFDSMKRYVEFLRANSDDHIINKLGKYGDWCPPGSIAPKKTPVELTSTWCYYHDVLTLSKIAAVIGRSEDAELYAGLTDEIKDAFNRAFLEEDQYSAHRVSPVDTKPNQTSNILPLYLDMVPGERKEKVLESLLKSVIEDHDYHLDTGIIGTRYILDVLTDNCHADVAYKVATQRTYPGWGYMVAEGATTLWERWEKITGGGMNSHNHIMLGSVDAWFYRTVAGISLLEPGWRKIRFKPPLFEDLSFASATLQTVQGEAHISWRRRRSAFQMAVRAPVGAAAEIWIPILSDDVEIKEGEKTIWKDGQLLEAPNGSMLFGLQQENYLILQAGSGEYLFSAINITT